MNLLAVVFLVVIGIITYDTYKAYRAALDPLKNDYKRWTEGEVFICAYVAYVVEDEVRLNDGFQKALARVLKRTERATNEKIRRLSSVNSSKSDASQIDLYVVNVLDTMSDLDAEERLDLELQQLDASRREVKNVLSYLN